MAAAVAIVATGAAAILIGVSQNGSGSSATQAAGDLFDTRHVIYRSLKPGGDFSRIGYAAVDEPNAEPVVAEAKCLRVAAAARSAVCMRTGSNPAQPYEVALLDEKLEAVNDEVLNGVPSRARLSPDGTHYATTVFVSGHNYISLGFSTETIIYETSGDSLGNLEEFDFMLNGEINDNEDRNIWGVTFAEDPNTFYATMATQGRTYLVAGDLEDRTLTAIQENAECPSLSPDGNTIVYKKKVAGGNQAWRFHAFDLRTGKETQLGESRSVDDQVAWLDNKHILYGVPKPSSGKTAADIWQAPLDGSQPSLFIEDADSPTVVG